MRVFSSFGGFWFRALISDVLDCDDMWLHAALPALVLYVIVGLQVVAALVGLIVGLDQSS